MSRPTPKSDVSRSRNRLLLSASIGVVVVSATFASAASADDILVSPPGIVEADPGSVTVVATEAVPAELVGQTCDLQITATNGSSTHIGNTAVVKTGTAQAEIPGIEDSPDGSVVAVQPMELGPTIVIELKMGSEGLSSLGFTAGFSCPSAASAIADVQAPEVAGAQQVAELPAAPVAQPVVGTPTFTG